MAHCCVVLTLLASVLSLVSVELPEAEAQLTSRPAKAELTIPWRDADGDGVSDYLGVRFDVSLALASGVQDFGRVCATSDSIEAQLPARGAAGNPLLATGTGVALLGPTCLMDVSFPSVTANVPADAADQASSVAVHLTPRSATGQVTGGGFARVTYSDGRTTFPPALTFPDVDLADVPAGSTFIVEYLKTGTSHGACRLYKGTSHVSGAPDAGLAWSRQDQETYEVQSDGSVTRTSDPVTLIDTPAGAPAGPTCEYEAIWGGIGPLRAPSDLPTFSAASPRYVHQPNAPQRASGGGADGGATQSEETENGEAGTDESDDEPDGETSAQDESEPEGAPDEQPDDEPTRAPSQSTPDNDPINRWHVQARVNVPWRDANGDGFNDYLAHAFGVTYEPSSQGPAIDNVLECEALAVPGFSARLPAIGDTGYPLVAVGADTSVVQDGGCVLDVLLASGVTANVPDGSGGTTSVVLTSDNYRSTLRRTENPVDADYTDGRTVFSSNLTFSGLSANQAGETFAVTYTKTASSHGACRLYKGTSHVAGEYDPNLDFLREDQETYEIQADGTATLTGSPALLIDAPAGAPSGTRCAYDVDLPAVDSYYPTRSVAPLSAGSQSASVRYHNRQERFTPVLRLRVPDVESTPGVSAFSGAQVRVEFERVDGLARGCSTGESVTLTLAADGSTTGVAPTLIDFPPRHDNNPVGCVYGVSAPEKVSVTGGGFLYLSEAAPFGRIDYSNSTLTIDYHTGFEPDVDIEVSEVSIDHSSPPQSRFAGKRFTVSFGRSGRSGCSSIREIYEVGTNGLVSHTSTSAPVLVDRAAGAADRCRYLVVYPDTEDGAAVGANELRSRQGTLDDTTDATDRETGIRYDHTGINFKPIVDIYLPFVGSGYTGLSYLNRLAGRQITVTYQRIPDATLGTACTPKATEVYTVQPSIKAPDASTFTVDSPADLIDRPPVTLNRCRYTATFSDDFGVPPRPGHSPPSSLYGLTTPGTVTFSASQPVQATYPFERRAENKTWYVHVNVPRYADDPNLFANTSIPLTVEPAMRSAPGCDSHTQDLTIAAEGTVPLATIDLLDTPENRRGQCRYDFSMPDEWHSLESSEPRWMLTQHPMQDHDPSKYFLYHGTVWFTPRVVITVPRLAEGLTPSPSPYAGLQFDVTFDRAEGSPNGCDDEVTKLYVVQANRDVAPANGVDLELIDRAPGELSKRCVYDVTFPVGEVRTNTDTGRLELESRLQYGQQIGVGIDKTIAAAIYNEATSRFYPSIDIQLPFADENNNTDYDRHTDAVYTAFGDDVNDLLDETITVTYRPDNSEGQQHGSCTAQERETYVVINDGSFLKGSVLSLQGDPASLVDRPQGEARQCRYTATFTGPSPAAIQQFGLQLPQGESFIAPGNLSPTYTVRRPATTSEWTFHLEAPLYTTQDDTTNFFAGETIVKSAQIYQPETVATTGCDDSPTVTLEIGEDSRATGTLTLTLTPVDSLDLCRYQFTYDKFDGEVNGQYWRATHQGVSWQTTEARNATINLVTNAIVLFPPEVQITIPTYNRDDDPATTEVDESEQNAFAGLRIPVTFRNTSGRARCDTEVVDFVVQPDGTLVPEGHTDRSDWDRPPDTVELVDRPWGTTNGRCGYRVEYGVRERDAAPADAKLARQDEGLDRRTQATDRPTGARYLNTESTFSPRLMLAFPFLEEDGTEGNDFAGETVTVTYTLATGVDQHDDCTRQSQTETYEVQPTGTHTDGGIATLMSTAATLVDRPAKQTTRCLYTATFGPPPTATVPHGVMAPPSIVSFDAATPLGAAYFVGPGGTDFAPEVSIDVPTYARESAPGARSVSPPTQEFAGTQFRVTFTPTDTSPDGCSERTPKLYEVDALGNTTPANNAVLRLVDRPSGVLERCVYRVDYPASEQVAQDATARLALRAHSTDEETEGREPATGAAYENVEGRFSPVVTIKLPRADNDLNDANDFIGEVITVSYKAVDGADPGCATSASETYRVVAGGTFETGSVLQLDRSTQASLIDRPRGISAQCRYTATFDGPFTGPSADMMRRVWGLQVPDPETFSSPGEITATYTVDLGAKSRTWTVNVTVPPYFDPDGRSLFANTDIAVSFTPPEREGCEPHDDITYIVQPNGSVNDTKPTLTFTPEDDPQPCLYDVTARTSISSPEAASRRWELALGDVTISNRGFTFNLPYIGTTFFEPDVDIAVPQYPADGAETGPNAFAGSRFTVGFGRASQPSPLPTGCEADEKVYAVGSDGEVELVDPNDAELVDRPPSTDDGTTRCVYTVTYPSDEDGATADLARQDAGLNLSTQATDAPTGATYWAAAATHFTPVVTLGFPYLDDDDTTGHDLAGQSVTVTYAPVANSNGGCTETTETYEIDPVGSYAAGGTTTLSSAAANLVDRPAGVEARCDYIATFGPPPQVAAALGVTAPPASAPLRARARSVTAAYIAPSTASVFDPAVTIGVPQFNLDDDPGTGADESTTKAFAGLQFTVSFARSGGPATSCSEGATPGSPVTEVYEVAATGTVGPADDSVPSLIDRPAGTLQRCVYAVTYRATEDVAEGATAQLARLAEGHDVSTQATDRATGARYAASTDSSFAPDVTLGFPYLDDDGASGNDFAGDTVTVTYAKVVGADDGCVASGIETYQIDFGGAFLTGSTTTLSSDAASLVDRPAGIETRCAYTATFGNPPQTAADLGVRAPPEAPVAKLTPVVTAYVLASSGTGASSSFTPDVTIRVPQFNLDDDPDTLADESALKAFAGLRFTVSFARSDGPATGCSEGTTPGSPVTEVYEVKATGAVGPADDSEPSLIDRPAGTLQRCVYEVTYRESEDGDTTRLTRQVDGLDLFTQATEQPTGATYKTSESTAFAPDVTLGFPFLNSGTGTNYFAGQTVTVTYARVDGSNGGCTETTETYEIDSGGSYVGGGTTTLSSDAASLVDRPAGVELRCAYTASFGAPPEAAAARNVAAPADAPLRALARSITTAYTVDSTVGYMTPTVKIVVPQYDRDGPSAGNFFTDGSFPVRFVRSGGPATDCSATTEQTVTYTVDTSGTVTGAAPQLVDRPAGTLERCVYTVTFPDDVPSPGGVAPAWQLTRADAEPSTAEVVGFTAIVDEHCITQNYCYAIPPRLVDLAPTVTRNYQASTVSRFTPDVAISVPQFNLDDDPGTGADEATMKAFAGLRFTVTFARASGEDGGPAEGCSEGTTPGSPVTEVYEVQATGAVAPADGTAPSLVDRPARTLERCVYEVTYRSTEDVSGGETARLARQADGLDVSTQATDRATGARYATSADGSFTPDVTLGFPYLEDDGTTGNDFAGDTVTVTYARVDGADTGCTTTDSETYQVDAGGSFLAGGTTTLTGDPASLIDRPAGVETRCAYTATFGDPPQAAASLNVIAPAAAPLGALARTINTAYTVVSTDSHLTRTVNIVVPQYDRDGQSGTNFFTDGSFPVRFVRSGGPASGCSVTTEQTVTYTAGTSGTVTGTTPQLVDRPANTLERCVYTLTFPDDVPSPAEVTPPWQLTLASKVPQQTLFESPAGVTPSWHYTRDDAEPTVVEVVGETAIITRHCIAENSCVDIPAQRIDVDATITRTYEASTVSRFAPDVSILVPQFNLDDDPGTVDDESALKAFAGLRFTVSFTRSDGPDTGCETANETYEVKTNGTAGTVDGGAPSLVDRPAGTVERCVYEATYGPTEDVAGGATARLARLAEGHDPPTQATDRATGARYATSADSSFTPDVTLGFPYLDDDGTAGNDFAGETVTVTYAPVANSDDGCTATDTETYAVGAGGSFAAGGTTTLSSAATSLVDRPAGKETRCAYTATFGDAPKAATDLNVTAPAAVSSLHALARIVNTAYTVTSAANHFTPTIDIRVPQYDREGESGTNFFTGGVFSVKLVRHDGPPASCSATSEQTVSYTVAVGGTVEGTAPQLVDRPAGTLQRCVYRLTFPGDVPSPSGVTPTWTLHRRITEPAAADIRAAAATVTRNYQANVDSGFTPDVTIRVPSYNLDDDPGTVADESATKAFAGLRFTVTFTRSAGPDEGCLTVNEIYEVGATGVVAPVDDSEPVLVDRPAGLTKRCVYDVNYRAAEDVAGGATARLARQAEGLDTSTQATNKPTGASYATSADSLFAPDVTLGFPYLDDDGTAGNDFAGEPVTVTYARVLGSDDGCTATDTETYEVDAGGDFAAGGTTTLSSDAASLVDRPAGKETRCAYTATFGPPPQVAADLGVRAPPEAPVAKLTPVVTAYVLASAGTGDASTFKPDVSITVPQFNLDDDPDTVADESTTKTFAGLRFTVSFARANGSAGGPTQGCSEGATPGSPVTELYEVKATGAVTPADGSAPSLVDRPGGTLHRCVYEVTYLPTEDVAGGATARLARLAEGLDASTQAADRATGARYATSADSLFAPDVTLGFPYLDDDGATGNDFAGETVTVTYERVGGSNKGCTATDTETYDVDAAGSFATGGTTTLSSAAANLVDRPAGVETRCAYSATFGDPPQPAADLGVTAPAAASLRALAPSIATAYTVVSADNHFTPTIDIRVPQYDREDAAGTNFFTGGVFNLQLVRHDGPATSCSATTEQTVAYTVAATGTVTGSAPQLVDRPANTLQRCVYRLTFPDDVPSPSGATSSWQLTRAGTVLSVADIVGPTATVTRNYAASTASRFTPEVDIRVPQFNLDDDPATFADESATKAFAGLRFTVSFARASGAAGGPAEGCSEGATPGSPVAEVYEVQATGAVAPADGGAPSLTDRPAGTLDRCVYEVTYLPTEDVVGASPGEGDAGADQPSQDGAVTRLARQAAGLDIETRATDRATGARYATSADSLFVPDVTLGFPYLDDDGATGNDFAGETATVTYARVGGSNAGCTATDTETYEVDAAGSFLAGGTTTLTSDAASLVDRPAGIETRCAYTASFGDPPQAAADLGVRAPAEAPVAKLTPVVTAYVLVSAGTGAASTFTPAVAITVPQFNLDDDPATVADESTTKAFAGLRFTVSFARASGAAGGPAEGCSEGATPGSPVSEVYEVQATGAVAPADGSAPNLVDRPAGTLDRCVYEVTYLPTEDVVGASPGEGDAGADQPSQDGAVTRLARQVDGLDVSTQATDRATRARYVTSADSSFTPDVTLGFPYLDDDGATGNDFAGDTVTVTYARVGGSNEGCTATDSETYEVDASGSFATGSTTTLSGDAASLVDRPAGKETRCAYTAFFGDPPQTAADLNVAAPSAAPLRALARSVTTAYTVVSSANHFTPTIDIRVPQYDREDAAGTNFFTGGVFNLQLVRHDGPATSCSATTEQTLTYTVAATGTVTGSAPQLVDRPANTLQRCVYRLTFPDDAPSPSGVAPTWTLHRRITEPAAADVRSGAAAATRNYQANVDSGFTPDVTIRVPSYNLDDDPDTVADESTTKAFAGLRFTVTFTRSGGPDAGCLTVTEIYEVRATGTVAPADGSEPTLIDRPAGLTDRCVYDVNYRATEDVAGGAAAQLARQVDGLDVSTQATDRATGARYATSADSSFAPDVTLGFPYLDDDGARGNDFAGGTVAVTYARVGGSNEGCTASDIETYEVDAGGSFAAGSSMTLTSAAASLVDRPAGKETRCSYTATFGSPPQPAADLGVTAPAAAPLRALARTITTAYTVISAAGYFEPEVSIAVPQFNLDDDPATVADESTAKAFVGLRFTVSFARASGAAGGPTEGCSTGINPGSPVEEIYEVTATGSVTPADGSAPSLVDRPAGTLQRCVYEVTYGDTEDAPAAPAIATFGAAISPGEQDQTNAQLARQTDGLDTETQATDRHTAARYLTAEASMFQPDVTINVPDYPAGGATGNMFEGKQFMVKFTRSDGPSDGCEPASEGYEVDVAGNVGPADNTAPMLVDRPAGQVDRCVYEVDYPLHEEGATAFLHRQSTGLDVSTEATDTATRAEYVMEEASTFTPTVTISVPQYDRDGAAGTNYFEGASFEASFAPAEGASVNCTPAPVNPTVYTVGASGEATAASSTLPTLINVPAAEEASCVYVVTFPPSARSAPGATPAWTLTGKDAAVAAISVPAGTTAQRRYEADASSFTPTGVRFDFPFVDVTPADGRNDLEAASGTVLLAPVTGADDDCSPQRTVIYTVGAGTSPSDASRGVLGAVLPTLVDRPAGKEVRCRYVADFPSTIGGARLTAADDRQSFDAASTITARYTYSPPAATVNNPSSGNPGAGRPPSGGNPGGGRGGGSSGGGGRRVGTPREVPSAPDEPEPEQFDEDEVVVVDGVPFSLTRSSIEVFVTVPHTPAGTFSPLEAIELIIHSPGACAPDVTFFGGSPVGVGVTYGVDPDHAGTQTLLGPDVPPLNENATSQLPTHAGVGMQPCVVRVTAQRVPAGCSLMGHSALDEGGRRYVERSLEKRPLTLEITAEFECIARGGHPPPSASATLAGAPFGSTPPPAGAPAPIAAPGRRARW